MAQWNHENRTLYAKLVYYGPALGGKTTNLELLHRITDPGSMNPLVSLSTSDDRTLFFDLLPLDLGKFLGYRIAIKTYTVPGQVRYESTRRIVLTGADAVVFVADSSAGREEQNHWSLQNLQMNMRANRLDPASVPVLFQFNKQDLPDAAPPEKVARWLGIPAGRGFPAVAVRGEGVLETFVGACRGMLERLVALAEDSVRGKLDPSEMGRQVERSFAPHFERLRHLELEPADAETDSTTSIRVDARDPHGQSVEATLQLGEKLATEGARARRLEREVEALRRLCDSLRSVGASFDRETIIEAALEAAAAVLEIPAVSLISEESPGVIAEERAQGRLDEPLLGSASGRALALRLISAAGPCVVDDLAEELAGGDAATTLRDLRAVAAVPVEPVSRRTLLAYAPQPDGRFDEQDVRFLAVLAGHLAVGLEKARLHAELARHRDRLEEIVEDRSRQLRKAYDDLRELESMKDRFLSNLSHEMKSPLTAVLTSATFLRDYQGTEEQRREMLESVLAAAGILEGQLEDLFRLVHLESDPKPLELRATDPPGVAAESIQLAGLSKVAVETEQELGPWKADLPRLSRAVANLLHNAVKFSPKDSPVELKITGAQVRAGDRIVPAAAISVLDRGPGVDPRDRERIFAPFEQGGDPMTDKPAGIGIGLAEARAITRQHGGQLEYRPRPGGGSEFRLRVPLQPEAGDRDVEVLGA